MAQRPDTKPVGKQQHIKSKILVVLKIHLGILTLRSLLTIYCEK